MFVMGSFRVFALTAAVLLCATACSGAFGFNNNYTVGSGGSGAASGSGCSYTNYVNYMLTLNPAGYWKLEDTGSTAADSSGNKNVGTLSNVTTGITPGPFPCASNRPAMLFNSSNNSKITTTTVFPDPLTYSEVILFKASGTGMLMAFSSSDCADWDRELYIDSDRKLHARIFDGQDQILSSPSAVVDGNWHLAVATESAAGLYLYLDGKLVASNATYNSPNGYSGKWSIGWTCDSDFDGWLAQAALTFPALTKAQVAKLAGYAGLAP